MSEMNEERLRDVARWVPACAYGEEGRRCMDCRVCDARFAVRKIDEEKNVNDQLTAQIDALRAEVERLTTLAVRNGLAHCAASTDDGEPERRNAPIPDAGDDEHERLRAVAKAARPFILAAREKEDFHHHSWATDYHLELTVSIEECRALDIALVAVGESTPPDHCAECAETMRLRSELVETVPGLLADAVRADAEVERLRALVRANAADLRMLGEGRAADIVLEQLAAAGERLTEAEASRLYPAADDGGRYPATQSDVDRAFDEAREDVQPIIDAEKKARNLNDDARGFHMSGSSRSQSDIGLIASLIDETRRAEAQASVALDGETRTVGDATNPTAVIAAAMGRDEPTDFLPEVVRGPDGVLRWRTATHDMSGNPRTESVSPSMAGGNTPPTIELREPCATCGGDGEVCRDYPDDSTAFRCSNREHSRVPCATCGGDGCITIGDETIGATTSSPCPDCCSECDGCGALKHGTVPCPKCAGGDDA